MEGEAIKLLRETFVVKKRRICIPHLESKGICKGVPIRFASAGKRDKAGGN